MNKTNELYIFDRDLKLIKSLIINDININEDIVSPQKSIIEMELDKTIEVSSFVLIKENSNKKFLGVIQDIVNDKKTTLYTYPLISLMDIDCELENINGNVGVWIINMLNNNFVNIDDKYTNLPLVFVENAITDSLELEVKTNNLFEVLLDIFLKTGVYIDFSLGITNGLASSIVCEVKKAGSDKVKEIKYDNPLFIEEPKIELSQAQMLNKIIYIPNKDNKTYKTETKVYYLLNNNTITENANATGRIKSVIQRIETYSDEDYPNLEKKAGEVLLGNSYSHQITLKMLNNDNYDFNIYDRVKYYGRDTDYLTYVTAIERITDKYSIVRLGVLRTKLTDTIKDINKKNTEIVKSVDNSIIDVNQIGSNVVFTKNNGSKTTIEMTGGSGGGSNINVIDSVESTSTTDALSANQGRLLNQNINSANSKLDSSLAGFQTQINNINTSVQDAVNGVSINNKSGILTFTRKNGTTFDVDTLLEKVVTNFTYNETTKNLELTLEDGTVKTIPMTAFIDDYDGVDGEIVSVSVSNDNKISATIKNGTISKTLLTTDLQEEIDNKATTEYVNQKNTEQDNNVQNIKNELEQKNTEQDNAITSLDNKKVDKVEGKQLSTNDYTTEEKNKLAGIEAGANKYVLPVANELNIGGVKAVPRDISHRRKVGVTEDGQLFSEFSLGITGTTVWENGYDLLDFDADKKLDVEYVITDWQKGSSSDMPKLANFYPYEMTKIEYLNGIYVGIYQDSYAWENNTYAARYFCYYSLDGVNWELLFMPDLWETDIVNPYYSPQLFVYKDCFVIINAQGRAFNSYNGKDWYSFRYFGPGSFAATRGKDVYYSFADGYVWYENFSSETGWVRAETEFQTRVQNSYEIIYANQMFVTHRGEYSVDGLKFSEPQIEHDINWVSLANTTHHSMAFGKGLILAIYQPGFIPNDGTSRVYWSADGKTWDYYTLDWIPTNIVFGDGMFVIGNKDKVMYSTDGFNWNDLGNPLINDRFYNYNGVNYINDISLAIINHKLILIPIYKEALRALDEFSGIDQVIPHDTFYIDFTRTIVTENIKTKYGELKDVDDLLVTKDLNGYATEDYVDTKIADLVNSAPETLDTLGEVATAIAENETVVNALNSAIGNKADKTTLNNYLLKSGGTVGSLTFDNVGKGLTFKTKDSVEYFIYGDGSNFSRLYIQIKDKDGNYQWYPFIDENGKLYSGKTEVAIKSDIPTNYVTTDTDQTVNGNKTFSNAVIAPIYKSDNSTAAFKLSANNELNFGSNGTDMYIGYDSTKISDTNAKVSKYRFGDSNKNGNGGTLYCNNVYVNNGTQEVAKKADIPTNNNQLTNGAGYITSNSLRTYQSLVPAGSLIPQNTDLNTITYIKVGSYYNNKSADVATFTNCPTQNAFMMTVYSPLSAAIDTETASGYIYRVRKILDYKGNEYIQSVYSGATAGVFTYGEWEKIAKISDMPKENRVNLLNTFGTPKESGTIDFPDRTKTKDDGWVCIVGRIYNNNWTSAQIFATVPMSVLKRTTSSQMLSLSSQGSSRERNFYWDSTNNRIQISSGSSIGIVSVDYVYYE